MFVWQGPIQIAENRRNHADCGGRARGSLAARAADKYRQKIAELPKKAPPAADLQGSAGPPRVTHRFTNRKVKLHRPKGNQLVTVFIRALPGYYVVRA